MILDTDQASDNPDLDQKRYRWPNGIVPYQISSNIVREDRRTIIIETIEELNEELCIDIR